MQTYYTLAKHERVERETIQKLVVTNPYTDGLKNLMYAWVAEYHYRFLLHQFINLKKGTDEPYDEAKYPLPDKLDLDTYIKGYNKAWARN